MGGLYIYLFTDSNFHSVSNITNSDFIDLLVYFRKSSTPILNISTPETVDPVRLANSDFILLADDDVDDQEMLVEAIKEIKPEIEFIGITNGKKAIAFLLGLADGVYPRVIILDYNLPEVNGSEILHAIASNKKFDSISKVVWSTSSSPIYKKACLDLGADAYLVKPLDLAGVQKVAHQLLTYMYAK